MHDNNPFQNIKDHHRQNLNEVGDTFKGKLKLAGYAARRGVQLIGLQRQEKEIQKEKEGLMDLIRSGSAPPLSYLNKVTDQEYKLQTKGDRMARGIRSALGSIRGEPIREGAVKETKETIMTLKDYYKQILSEGSRGVERLKRKAIGIANAMKRQNELFPSTSDSMGHAVAAELVGKADETLAQIKRATAARFDRSKAAQISSAIGSKPARVFDAKLKSRTGKSLKDLASGHGDALNRAEEILTGDRTVTGDPMDNTPLEKSEELRASGRFTVNRTPSDEALRAADERSAAGAKQRDYVKSMGGNKKEVNRRYRREQAITSVVDAMQQRGDERQAVADANLKKQRELKREDLINRHDAEEDAMTIPQRIARAIRNIV